MSSTWAADSYPTPHWSKTRWVLSQTLGGSLHSVNDLLTKGEVTYLQGALHQAQLSDTLQGLCKVGCSLGTGRRRGYPPAASPHPYLSAASRRESSRFALCEHTLEAWVWGAQYRGALSPPPNTWWRDALGEVLCEEAQGVASPFPVPLSVQRATGVGALVAALTSSTSPAARASGATLKAASRVAASAASALARACMRSDLRCVVALQLGAWEGLTSALELHACSSATIGDGKGGLVDEAGCTSDPLPSNPCPCKSIAAAFTTLSQCTPSGLQKMSRFLGYTAGAIPAPPIINCPRERLWGLGSPVKVHEVVVPLKGVIEQENVPPAAYTPNPPQPLSPPPIFTPYQPEAAPLIQVSMPQSPPPPTLGIPQAALAPIPSTPLQLPPPSPSLSLPPPPPVVLLLPSPCLPSPTPALLPLPTLPTPPPTPPSIPVPAADLTLAPPVAFVEFISPPLPPPPPPPPTTTTPLPPPFSPPPSLYLEATPVLRASSRAMAAEGVKERADEMIRKLMAPTVSESGVVKALEVAISLSSSPLISPDETHLAALVKAIKDTLPQVPSITPALHPLALVLCQLLHARLLAASGTLSVEYYMESFECATGILVEVPPLSLDSASPSSASHVPPVLALVATASVFYRAQTRAPAGSSLSSTPYTARHMPLKGKLLQLPPTWLHPESVSEALILFDSSVRRKEVGGSREDVREGREGLEAFLLPPSPTLAPPSPPAMTPPSPPKSLVYSLLPLLLSLVVLLLSLLLLVPNPWGGMLVSPFSPTPLSFSNDVKLLWEDFTQGRGVVGAKLRDLEVSGAALSKSRLLGMGERESLDNALAQLRALSVAVAERSS